MTQQQPRGQGGQGGQRHYDEYQHLIPQSGVEFDEDLTSELRVAIHDLEDVSRKTKWCIDKMVDEGPEMASCVRACRDVGTIADLVVDFVATDSIYTIEGALLFVTVAEDAIQEIESHQHPHCQETADAVGRAIDSAWGILEAFGDPGTFQQALGQFRQVRQDVRQTQKLPHAMGGAQQGGGTSQGGMTRGGQTSQGGGSGRTGMQEGGQQPAMQQGGQWSGTHQGGHQPDTQQGSTHRSGGQQGGMQRSGRQGQPGGQPGSRY